MKLTVFAGTLAFLLWGAAPAFAGPTACVSPDFEGDTVIDCQDNCSTMANPAQDDTDGDFCGNICDADYDQSGGPVSVADFGGFATRFGTFDLVADHTEPVTGPVAIGDFGKFTLLFGKVPGPSGTTPGTTACP